MYKDENTGLLNKTGWVSFHVIVSFYVFSGKLQPKPIAVVLKLFSLCASILFLLSFNCGCLCDTVPLREDNKWNRIKGYLEIGFFKYNFIAKFQ